MSTILKESSSFPRKRNETFRWLCLGGTARHASERVGVVQEHDLFLCPHPRFQSKYREWIKIPERLFSFSEKSRGRGIESVLKVAMSRALLVVSGRPTSRLLMGHVKDTQELSIEAVVSWIPRVVFHQDAFLGQRCRPLTVYGKEFRKFAKRVVASESLFVVPLHEARFYEPFQPLIGCTEGVREVKLAYYDLCPDLQTK